MKIAVYGGAFNPVHQGHVQIAEQLHKKYNFDKILVIPSKFSPHKSNDFLVSDEHRLKMCQLAFSKIENCEVSDIEIKRNDISYTVNTLSELKNIYKNSELFLICGSDMFLTLLNWKNPKKIFELSNILAFRRDKEKIAEMLEYKTMLEENGASVELCNIDIAPYSSTEIRQAISKSKKFDNFVNKDVYDYIIKYKLYV